MKTFLIAHTNNKGTNVAQASIRARTQVGAEKAFRKNYPQRKITVVGIRGEEG